MASYEHPEEILDHVKRIPKEQWERFFDLVDRLEKTEVFGHTGEWKEDEDGTIEIPHTYASEIVEEFRTLYYEMELHVPFDWSTWEEGKQIISDPETDFSQLDLLTLLKLLTAVLRSDHFSEGVLVEYFENGVMGKILKALKGEIA
jgi:hypothetical protein